MKTFQSVNETWSVSGEADKCFFQKMFFLP